jgi:hypothetical protein
MNRPHRIGLVVWFAGGLASVMWADPKPAASNEAPVKMDPIAVSARFPAIELRFILLGENLVDPAKDKIVGVSIAKVVPRSAESGPEILVWDKPEAINGEQFKGKTLTEVAAVLAHARSQGIPKWRLKRGLRTIEVPFDGEWLVPLPGLKR